MPYNLLLLPLIGGYFFITTFVYLKYKYRRLSAQRILFASIITGTIFLFIVFIIRAILYWYFPELKDLVLLKLDNFPLRKIDYLWTAIFTFLLAFIGTHVANGVLSIIGYRGLPNPMAWAVKRYGNELEQLFMQSAIDGSAIQITLKNRKVYIGFATEIPKPGETNYLKLTPILSGARKSETMEFRVTTNYFVALKEIENEYFGAPRFNYDITIKQDEILTATPFNPELQSSLEKMEKKN
ncbi:hypothetical protein [Allomuricauda sp. SCSIO 65647]|uniref:hypothetical protein n=1 Tax=Allomuricauda sp. SCSIO 65647 TaxID=2908843 RepID=UPI001F44098C|nr:hypothetical protein [Muricauda sp. SCSIO 65647]UJH68316.1 hypothetical protein L0P89_03705 [Muricauda sp. SCSIO 65647]